MFEYTFLSSITPDGLGFCLLGFSGCSSVDPPAEIGYHAAIIGKMDPPNEDEDVVAANRDWYQTIR